MRIGALPYVLGAAVVSACAAGLPHPDEAQLARAQAEWPGITAADLEAGRRSYVNRCAGCHALHRPAEYDAGQWGTLVEKMAVRAKLTAPEKESILRYLGTAATPEG